MELSTVHFADYIKMLPSAWVFEHFIKGTDSKRKILSSSMIDQTIAEFVDFVHLKQQYLKLAKEYQLQCALIYLLGKTGMETSAIKGLENPLLLSFLVYAAINQNGTVRLLGFDEFRPALLDLCKDTLFDHFTVKEHAVAVYFWQSRSVSDITITVSMAAQRQLKKKKNGGLTRAASVQMKTLTEMGSVLKNINGDYINNLMISYCLSRQMILETDTEYLLNSAEFDNWLSLPINERIRELTNFIYSFTGEWWLELLRALIEKQVWIPISIFPESIQPDAIDTLKGLRFAGMIEIRSNENEIAFCKSDQLTSLSGQEVRNVMILPDFSVIIAQETDPSELYRFSQVGCYSVLDRVYKGKIDKTVLGDSLSRGIEGDSVLEWLEKWQAPANVKETVREWLREFYRLYITNRSLLVSSDEKVSFQIDSFEPLRSLIEKIPAHSLYKIKKGNERQVQEILANLGFDYRMPGQDLEIEILQHSSDQTAISSTKWMPLIEPRNIETDAPTMRGTKYGGELKSLDMSETIHVIDYAILTGQNIIIDYEGSPYIKEGQYSIKPLSCQKGIEPVLDVEMIRTHSRKQLYIKKIRKIGVQLQ